MNPTAILDHRPADRAERAAILLHGRNRAPAEMRNLAADMGLLGWRLVFPAAEGGSWYPGHFMDEIATNEPALGNAVAAIETEVARLGEEGFGPHQLLVGGFSQGACVICEYLLRRQPTHLAAIIFSGGSPGPLETRWPDRPGISGTTILVTAGSGDPFVRVARVHETVTWMTASGAKVRTEVFDRRTHAVEEDDLEAAREFIATISGQAPV